MMKNPEEIISKIRAARVRYLEAVVRWRAVRDEAEKNLQAAEHDLAQGLALVDRPESSHVG